MDILYFWLLFNTYFVAQIVSAFKSFFFFDLKNVLLFIVSHFFFSLSPRSSLCLFPYLLEKLITCPTGFLTFWI